MNVATQRTKNKLVRTMATPSPEKLNLPLPKDAAPGDRVQFERKGYFCADSEDSAPGAPVFNRTVTLRDTWAKIEKRDASA